MTKSEKTQNIFKDIFPEIITPNEAENQILNELDSSYLEISEMTEHERQFLNTLILRTKPKKLLEIGVSRGGSSVIMLNAIKENKIAKLYSIDRYERFYDDKNVMVGSAVDKYPHLKNKWKLYTEDLTLGFIDEIGHDIDFCLIDTMHILPGEILDFLMVLPYLKDDALIVFHDTNLHTHNKLRNELKDSITNNLLMSTIQGHKFIQGNFTNNNTAFSNIGAVKLNSNSKLYIWELFNLLTIKWSYMPSNEDLFKVVKHYERFYNPLYIEYLKKVIEFHLIEKQNAELKSQDAEFSNKLEAIAHLSDLVSKKLQGSDLMKFL